jgi:serralysin
VAATSSYGPTGNPAVDGLLSGSKWAIGSLTYSFPTSASFYGSPYGSGEPTSNFEAFNSAQQTATRTILKLYSSVANIQFVEVTESASVHGDLRYAMSDKPGTAWAYYPTTAAEGGDAWFNNSKGYYDNPIKGNYGYLTIMHESGHALGLKHPHEVSGSFGAMPLSYDSLEYSVMSYRSYVGGPATAYTVASTSYPQSLMMYDIAALQKMYGANYSTNGSDTVYTWSATTGEMSVNGVGQGTPAGNKIFMTVWDGGGVDTYDFSNYGTNLVVSLLPGGWTTVSTTQLAVLGSGKYAVGNIANALLFEGNPASLIENVIGGSGSDMILGNTAKNGLTGGAGNDVLDGGAGVDTALYTGLFASYWIVENTDGSWTVADQQSGGTDGTDTLWNMELLQFADLLYALGDFDPPPPPDPEPQPNEAPLAHDDVFSTSKSTKLTISGAGVLANDSDPDGDLLSAVLVNGTRNGTLSLQSDGSFIYTPRKNFIGTDSFTYRVNDGSLDDVATVTIIVTGSTVGGKGKGKIHGPERFDMEEEQLPAPSAAAELNGLRQLEGTFLPMTAWSGNGVPGASVLEQLAQAHAADFAHG